MFDVLRSTATFFLLQALLSYLAQFIVRRRGRMLCEPPHLLEGTVSYLVRLYDSEVLIRNGRVLTGV
jgi:hypothetical protein